MATLAPVRKKPPRPAPLPIAFYRSAIGKKWVMAITGIVLLGYVLIHMVGNLHLYEGPGQVNHYGEALRALGGDLAPRTFALWVLRVVLASAFFLHIHAAYALTVMNHRARPDDYRSKRDYVAADFASRTMRWSGVIVLLFVVFHLADLTWGTTNPDYIRGDVYHNTVASFERLPVAILYIVANLALAFHIYHGAWSMFQSMGINNPKYNALRRRFAQGFAALILIGNVSFPLSVQFGLIDEENRTTPLANEETDGVDDVALLTPHAAAGPKGVLL